MPSDRPTRIFGYIERSLTRGYASFFEWPLDRNLAELGVVNYLVASMAADRQNLFANIQSRGRGNDPPDCEATDSQGRRVAIEVTELVDPKGIANSRRGASANGRCGPGTASWPALRIVWPPRPSAPGR